MGNSYRVSERGVSGKKITSGWSNSIDEAEAKLTRARHIDSIIGKKRRL